MAGRMTAGERVSSTPDAVSKRTGLGSSAFHPSASTQDVASRKFAEGAGVVSARAIHARIRTKIQGSEASLSIQVRALRTWQAGRLPGEQVSSVPQRSASYSW